MRPKWEHQSETDFLSQCNLPGMTNARRAAHAVRLTIADLGEVNPDEISATLKFEDLDSLTFWKSCGDVGFETDTFARELQRNLGIKLNPKQLSKIRDPDLNTHMTIADFVHDVWGAINR